MRLFTFFLFRARCGAGQFHYFLESRGEVWYWLCYNCPLIFLIILQQVRCGCSFLENPTELMQCDINFKTSTVVRRVAVRFDIK